MYYYFFSNLTIFTLLFVGDRMKKNDNSIIHGLLKYWICEKKYLVNDTISSVTTNLCKALWLLRKVSIKINNDADMIIMDNDYNIDTVISNGKTIVKEKE